MEGGAGLATPGARELSGGERSVDPSTERRCFELLERVVDLLPEEREAILARTDPKLAREVQTMLAAQEAADDGICSTSAVAAIHELPAQNPPPTPVSTSTTPHPSP